MQEYVVEELNVRALETCDQPLQYAQLRAEPDWKVLCSCNCLPNASLSKRHSLNAIASVPLSLRPAIA